MEAGRARTRDRERVERVRDDTARENERVDREYSSMMMHSSSPLKVAWLVNASDGDAAAGSMAHSSHSGGGRAGTTALGSPGVGPNDGSFRGGRPPRSPISPAAEAFIELENLWIEQERQTTQDELDGLLRRGNTIRRSPRSGAFGGMMSPIRAAARGEGGAVSTTTGSSGGGVVASTSWEAAARWAAASSEDDEQPQKGEHGRRVAEEQKDEMETETGSDAGFETAVSTHTRSAVACGVEVFF